MKKKLVSGLVSALLLVTFFTGSSSAKDADITNFDIVQAKKELVVKAQEAEKFKKQHNLITNQSKENVDHLLAKMVAEQEDATTIKQTMENNGLYKLDVPEKQFGTTSTDNSNVSLTTPDVYYDARNSEWIAVGGGYWRTDKWVEYIPKFWGTDGIGSTRGVGGLDGFGVAYTNLNGKYSSSVKSSYGYMSDGQGNEVTTTVRSDGDGSKGFGFQLRDAIRKKCTCIVYTSTPDNFSYIGKHFSGLTRYDQSFGSVSGNATTYYLHTYSSASISSIQFGISGKVAGLQYTITDSQYSWPAFSSDKKF
ncbi:hypothetical protein [Paenibacillus chitinolyticus]|uniref:hypothetical protein n=1 Tax=Paenibacillus chitinolyticus TaxID=79263 RepID=UPI003D077A33